MKYQVGDKIKLNTSDEIGTIIKKYNHYYEISWYEHARSSFVYEAWISWNTKPIVDPNELFKEIL